MPDISADGERARSHRILSDSREFGLYAFRSLDCGSQRRGDAGVNAGYHVARREDASRRRFPSLIRDDQAVIITLKIDIAQNR